MEKERPAYYANIPASVRYDESLTPNAKLLYGEITALCNKEGHCWASNKYFADLYKVAPGTISEWVRLLVEAGHISYTVENQNSRRIFLKGVSGNPEGGIRKSRRGVSGYPEHNTTVDNTTNTTTTSEQGSRATHDPLGADIIKAFETVDSKNKIYYGNTTQRTACDFLIAEYGFDEVLRRVNVLPRTNTTLYFPKIYTPLQLKEKWQQLEDAAHTKHNEGIIKKPVVLV